MRKTAVDLTPLVNEVTGKAVLKLASLRVFTAHDAVTALLPAIGKRKVAWTNNDQLVSPYFFDMRDWESQQQWLRRFLPVIAKQDARNSAELNELMEDINLTSEFVLIRLSFRFGRLEWRVREDRSDISDSVNRCVWRAVVPFFMPDGWSPRRLGLCTFRRCGEWFLRPTAQRGSVTMFCCRQHANAEQQARLRDRRKRVVKSANNRRAKA